MDRAEFEPRIVFLEPSVDFGDCRRVELGLFLANLWHSRNPEPLADLACETNL